MNETKVPGPSLDNDLPLICDLVMKGGITSGVVYPGAIVELAENYRFHRIGGSSAGAIAASLTAAAEYRRQQLLSQGVPIETATASAFGPLAQLPRQLGEPVEGMSRLLSLFQPQRQLRRLWRVLSAATGGGLSAGMRMWFSALAAYRTSWLGVLPVLWLVMNTAPSANSTVLVLQVVAAIMLVIGTPTLLVLVAFALDLASIARHGFGICDGQSTTQRGCEPLTPWLHDKLQSTSGLSLTVRADTPEQERVLCFRDLWETRHPYADTRQSRRGIDLRITTTSLTWQQLLCLPSDSGDYGELYFKPAEFRRWFPLEVVEHMVRKARSRPDDNGFCRMPEAADLPVIVAVRMSLSFPILLTPIKLYHRDWSRRGDLVNDRGRQRELDDAARDQLRPVYFSDGGICSNLPVHFFDSLVPAHPTFAINLGTPHPDADTRPDHFQETRVAQNQMSGSMPGRYSMHEHEGPHGLGTFLWSIVDSARNWADNGQLRLDGYRERVAHIVLREDEGGLNLGMSHEQIQLLASRGSRAARELHELFNSSPKKGGPKRLDLHRCDRMAIALSALAEALEEIEINVAATGDPMAYCTDESLRTFAQAIAQLTASPAVSELLALERERYEERLSNRHLSHKPHLRLRARL
ncbi:MAG: patatin-like phospholipase family protein [Xanthomonadales bacterium]|nr:patatin-like phospholipase family protein [Xanthomonadales bacterium]MCC6559799.1 patatin-like phospholipase family protein [Xanthomonadales bacterium]